MHYFDNGHVVIEHTVSLEEGALIKIEVHPGMFVEAVLAWTAGNICGCKVLDGKDAFALHAQAVDTQLSDPPLEPVEIFEPPEPVGVRLGRLRRLRGLTQQELATAIGVSKPTVWKWEQGLNKPKDEMLGRISKALGVPKSEFIRPQGMLRSGVDVIRGCRFYIASACNVPPACVKITIEA